MNPHAPPSPSAGPLVKVCGLRSVENALACVEAGADWIGLNFHPASPRSVSISVAAEIVRALPSHARAVGLFVDRPVAEIRDVAREVGLNTVQLHGREPLADALRLLPLRTIKAFRLGDDAALRLMRDAAEEASTYEHPPLAFLIDAYVPGREGGTGVSIPASLLDALPRLALPLVLAGGLTPDNVAERAARVRPWVVDVASGVESAPGVKDPDAVRRFVAEARRGTAGPEHA